MSKFTVNYMPSELSKVDMKAIRDRITPSMRSDETNQYQCDEILQEFWQIQKIVEACEWCDYLEI